MTVPKYKNVLYLINILTLTIPCLFSCANTRYIRPYTRETQVSSQQSNDQRHETQRSEFWSNTDEFEGWYYSKEYEQSLIEKGATPDQFERLNHLKKYEQSLIKEGATPEQLKSCRHMIEEMRLEFKEIEKKGIANWVPLIEGSSLRVDENYSTHPSQMKLNNGMLLNQVDWNLYLKPFVEGLPMEKREAVLNGITRFYHKYDKVDKEIKFEPLRYISEPYSSASYVSLIGSIQNNKASAFVVFMYYGSSWVFANRIKVVADDFTWQSPPIKFYRDDDTDIWEYTYFDVSVPKVREVINKITTSKESIVRFQGDQYYSDLTVSTRMKKDLESILLAIDTINN